MARLDAFFKLMFDSGASDLHIVAGSPPILRVHGELERIKYDILEEETLRGMLYEIAPEQKIKTFEETGDVDFGYEIPGVARFRCNFFMQKYGCGAVFRQIPTKVLTADELGLPPILKKSAMLHKGLVLATGPTGSGKSTTLAAVIDHANKHRKDHIITIEDPIEFVHQSQGCLVNHREVGVHTKGFASALKGALREDPDIILVGEMRDLETISVAPTAAETGHLVFATLHTQDAAQTIDRIIDVFPTNQQQQVRVQLAGSLQGVVCQTLAKTRDGHGRAVATEVLVATPAIRNLIREGKTHQIYSAMQAGAKHGMHTMDQHLADLVMKGKITYEVGLEKCHHVEDFSRLAGRG
jgi:twitching motility protein PilT